jgi:NADH-quinone oxidoreductase subunit M
LPFLILTTFLITICLFLSFSVKGNKTDLKDYVVSFLLLESILIGVFCSLDLLLFYIFFEAVLIPMYFIVGRFGSRSRKIRASYLLFIYTLFSSIIMFLAILYLYSLVGTTNLLSLSAVKIEPLIEKICWIAFFFSFAVKMPLVPFHIWLPEAHCEAPTAGSVILAGILLKLGGYGFIRFSLLLFPNASAFFSPLIFLISIIGTVYSSITTLQQVDLKKVIAYSSVGHMGVVTIGIFCSSPQGILGSIYLMLAHGITSSGLFLLIGLLYDKYGTRIIKYYGGLFHTMPIFSVTFLIFTMANLGLPGTSNFIGEFLIFIGCFGINSWSCFFCGSSLILGAGYSLWLSNRLLFGNIKYDILKTFKDFDRKDFWIFLPLIFLTIFLGIFPDCILNIIKSSKII